MMDIVATIVTGIIMFSYILIYKAVRVTIKIVTFIVYRSSYKVFIEKRDMYLKKLAKVDEQLVMWSSESEENLLVACLICGLLSIGIIGYIVLWICKYYDRGIL